MTTHRIALSLYTFSLKLNHSNMHKNYRKSMHYVTLCEDTSCKVKHNKNSYYRKHLIKLANPWWIWLCIRYTTYVIFNHIDTLRETLVSSFYRWANWASEKLNKLTKVTQLVIWRARICIQFWAGRKFMPFFCNAILTPEGIFHLYKL